MKQTDQTTPDTEVVDFCRKIGANLRRIREERQEALSSVAKALGRSVAWLRKVEQGDIQDTTIKLVIELCDWYQVSPLAVFPATAAGEEVAGDHSNDHAQANPGESVQ